MMIKNILLLLTIFVTSNVLANGISLNKSRIIFNYQDASQDIQLKNDANKPIIVQTSILDTDKEKQNNEFIVLPPLFRVEANSDYSVRIKPSDISKLPKDRESLFFFKARAIPPTNKNEDEENKLSVVFVTAIVVKIFYRPEGVSAPKSNDYRRVVMRSANGKWLIDNPTPFNMTIVDFTFNGNKLNETILIPPFNNYVMNEIKSDNKSLKGSWRFITDYGSVTEKYNFDSSVIDK